MRYTSLIATISHDNNNHRTSKHASTSRSSDGSPSCLGGSSNTRVGPGQNPQCTRAHFGGEAVGCSTSSTTHNNESKKTQNNDNMVAEQVLCDLSKCAEQCVP